MYDRYYSVTTGINPIVLGKTIVSQTQFEKRSVISFVFELNAISRFQMNFYRFQRVQCVSYISENFNRKKCKCLRLLLLLFQKSYFLGTLKIYNRSRLNRTRFFTNCKHFLHFFFLLMTERTIELK